MVQMKNRKTEQEKQMLLNPRKKHGNYYFSTYLLSITHFRYLVEADRKTTTIKEILI